MNNLVNTAVTDINLPVEAMIITLIASAVFGFALYMIYALYYHDNEPQDGSLARGLVMLTPALAVTFMVIQSSLALSLGLLGSLSFVRFRTQVKRTEDICFVIIAIAVAIACSISQYVAASVLVVMLFIYSCLRNRISSSKRGTRYAIITFNTKGQATVEQLNDSLDDLRIRASFVSFRSYDGITSFVFNASRVGRGDHEAIATRLRSFDAEAQINVFYPNERLGA